MTDIESGQLVLNTLNATRKVVSYVVTFKFSNINIREILGDMYDKYDKFKLCLNGLQMGGSNIADRICYIRMSGLNWVGELGYNDNDTFKALITLDFINSNPSVSGHPCNIGNVFNKPSNNVVDLTIHMGDVFTNGTSYWNYGNLIFYFSIFGVI